MLDRTFVKTPLLPSEEALSAFSAHKANLYWRQDDQVACEFIVNVPSKALLEPRADLERAARSACMSPRRIGK